MLLHGYRKFMTSAGCSVYPYAISVEDWSRGLRRRQRTRSETGNHNTEDAAWTTPSLCGLNERRTVQPIGRKRIQDSALTQNHRYALDYGVSFRFAYACE